MTWQIEFRGEEIGDFKETCSHESDLYVAIGRATEWLRSVMITGDTIEISFDSTGTNDTCLRVVRDRGDGLRHDRDARATVFQATAQCRYCERTENLCTCCPIE